MGCSLMEIPTIITGGSKLCLAQGVHSDCAHQDPTTARLCNLNNKLARPVNCRQHVQTVHIITRTASSRQ